MICGFSPVFTSLFTQLSPVLVRREGDTLKGALLDSHRTGRVVILEEADQETLERVKAELKADVVGSFRSFPLWFYLRGLLEEEEVEAFFELAKRLMEEEPELIVEVV